MFSEMCRRKTGSTFWSRNTRQKSSRLKLNTMSIQIVTFEVITLTGQEICRWRMTEIINLFLHSFAPNNWQTDQSLSFVTSVWWLFLASAFSMGDDFGSWPVLHSAANFVGPCTRGHKWQTWNFHFLPHCFLARLHVYGTPIYLRWWHNSSELLAWNRYSS